MTDEFVLNANLPDRDVTAVVISDVKKDIIDELYNNYHIKALIPSPVLNISGQERFHADMGLLHFYRDNFFLSSDNIIMTEILKEKSAEIIHTKDVTASEPKLNVCILKNIIIMCKKTADASIADRCIENGFRIIEVSQKYVKCSTAVVAENAVITSDESIYRACRKNLIDVLRIPAGNILLDGYEYGFIGGCCGLLSDSILAFSGDIDKHPFHKEIRDFALNYGVYTASLGKNELYDIGGILPVRQKCAISSEQKSQSKIIHNK